MNILILTLMALWNLNIDGKNQPIVNESCHDCVLVGDIVIDHDSRLISVQTEFIFKDGFEND